MSIIPKCEHKYVHQGITFRTVTRNDYSIFIYYDTYYCEKCLDHQAIELLYSHTVNNSNFDLSRAHFNAAPCHHP